MHAQQSLNTQGHLKINSEKRIEAEIPLFLIEGKKALLTQDKGKSQ